MNAIIIPVANAGLSCNSQYTLQLDVNQQWTDQWYHDYTLIVAGNPVNYHDPISVSNQITVHSSFTPTIESSTCQISFQLDNEPQNSFQATDQDGDNASYLYNDYAQDVGQVITQNFTPFTNIAPPPISTFAVSNLLFPQQHILNFKNVYLPGDLVIFGDIFTSSVATSPASATVAAGQTQQFTATSKGQPAAVTWSISPRRGQISATGVYTAPGSVSRTQNILVTATTSDGTETSHAVVMLVPAGVLLAPNAVIVQTNTPQQFVASVTGEGSQAVTWSSSPASIGTISADGTYTPPASVQSPILVTITATSQANPQVQGSALAVVLTGLDTEGMTVSPTSASLQSSQTQQFNAENAAGKPLTPTWSVVSVANMAGNAGSIDANGNYTAPATLTSAQLVVIVATLQDPVANDTLAATALVYLELSVDD